jgi:hypothetical protein
LNELGAKRLVRLSADWGGAAVHLKQSDDAVEFVAPDIFPKLPTPAIAKVSQFHILGLRMFSHQFEPI